MALNTNDSVTVLWRTPDPVFKPLHRRFSFEIDAAAIAWNAKLPKYWTPEQNALHQDWDGKRIWCNPPYGFENIGAFLKKGEIERRKGAMILYLLPAHPDREWFREHVIEKDGFTPRAGVKYWWSLGRIKFELPPWIPQEKQSKAGNTQGSVFVLFRPLDPKKFYSNVCPVCNREMPQEGVI